MSDLEIGEIKGWNACLKHLNDFIGEALRQGVILTQVDFEKFAIDSKKDETVLP